MKTFSNKLVRIASFSLKKNNAKILFRPFAVSTTSKAPPSLASVLTRELEYEKEEGSASSEAAMNEIRSELKEWTFHVESQKSRFSLTKKFGAQEVKVDVDCTPMPAEEDEGAEDEANEGAEGAEEEEPAESDGYRMLVTIKDPSKTSTMQVGCFLGSSLRIHRVTLFPAGKEPSADIVFGGFDEIPLYAGPNFDELDNAVNNAFYEYLMDRGIDDAFAERLADFAQSKEQTEYVRWLAAARDFASK